MGALSQVTGFTEADAHLLPDKPHDLRLQLTDDLSHAAGAQNFDFGSFHCVRNEIDRAGQDCGARRVDHRRLPVLSKSPGNKSLKIYLNPLRFRRNGGHGKNEAHTSGFGTLLPK